MQSPASHQCFETNSPAVVSEVIDGEAIIMNLKSGNYFSIQQTGAKIWEWINDGRPFQAVVELAQRSFAGEPEKITRDLEEFLGALLEHELIRPCSKDGQPGGQAVTDEETPVNRPAFEKPEVHVFNDMKDLLLLDPIHDVDETGWPRMLEEDQSGAR
jgi:hypothetical protein